MWSDDERDAGPGRITAVLLIATALALRMWKEAKSVRVAAMIVPLALSSIVSGCSEDGGAKSSGDCSAQVRAGGIVSTSYGSTDRHASRRCSRPG